MFDIGSISPVRADLSKSAAVCLDRPQFRRANMASDQDFSSRQAETQDSSVLNQGMQDASGSLWKSVENSLLSSREQDNKVSTPELTEKEKLEFAKRCADNIIKNGDIGKEAFDQIQKELKNGKPDPDLIAAINKELAGKSSFQIALHQRFVPVITIPEVRMTQVETSISLIDKNKIKEDEGNPILRIRPAGQIAAWPVRQTTTSQRLGLDGWSASQTEYKYYPYQPRIAK